MQKQQLKNKNKNERKNNGFTTLCSTFQFRKIFQLNSKRNVYQREYLPTHPSFLHFAQTVTCLHHFSSKIYFPMSMETKEKIQKFHYSLKETLIWRMCITYMRVSNDLSRNALFLRNHLNSPRASQSLCWEQKFSPIFYHSSGNLNLLWCCYKNDDAKNFL